MSRWLVIAIVLGACSRASDEGEARQWQKQEPPKEVMVPAGLAIAVDVDGGAKSPITSDTLRSVKPDFADAERKAWLIPSLVSDARSPGSVVEASAATGVSVKFGRPTADGLEPVLFLTRRGEVIVSAIDPKDPFPRYHGQGGRLHRAGDAMPHVTPVSRLAITHPPKP